MKKKILECIEISPGYVSTKNNMQIRALHLWRALATAIALLLLLQILLYRWVGNI